LRPYDDSIPGYVEFPGPQIPEDERCEKWDEHWQSDDEDESFDNEMPDNEMPETEQIHGGEEANDVDLAAVERYVADLPESDPEEPESEYEEFQEAETEEDEGGYADPTCVTSIKEERIFYNGKSFQRQYRVHRLDPTYNIPRLPWTRANVLDGIMDVNLLVEWRSAHPISDIHWKFSGKGNKNVQAKHRQKWQEHDNWKREIEVHLNLIGASEQQQ
jgi:hypothetical protein